ncbi:MAG: hypothetical protein QXL78_02555 [Methanocellales archaeon]
MNRIIYTLLILLFLIVQVQVQAQAIPQNLDKFLNDYYDVTGKPNLNATLQQNEFEPGEHAILYITLLNSGKLEKFEVNKQANASKQAEVIAAQKEQQLENEATTAFSIVLTLNKGNQSDPYKLKANTAFAGTLRSGLASTPIPFKIEVEDNAPLGEYELILSLTYDFQRDVAVEENYENPNAPNIYYWYDQASKNITLKLKIAQEAKAEFEVVEVRPSSFKVASEDNLIWVELKNKGSESARDLVAMLRPAPGIYVDSAESPIAELKPGEARELVYKIDVDKDALPGKSYQMKLELKFYDPYGNELRDHAYFYIETQEKAAQIPGLDIATLVAALLILYLYILTKRR